MRFGYCQHKCPFIKCEQCGYWYCCYLVRKTIWNRLPTAHRDKFLCRKCFRNLTNVNLLGWNSVVKQGWSESVRI